MALEADGPMIVVLTICICLLSADINCFIQASTLKDGGTHPANEFTAHTLLKPRIYHGREKRQITTTREEGEGNSHVHHITVDYSADDARFVLDLQLNQNLLPLGYFQQHQKHGAHVVNKPSANTTELCHYQGTVRGKPHSWVAISTCEDRLRGVVFDGDEMHYLEHLDGQQLLFKHADLKTPANASCGYNGADAQRGARRPRAAKDTLVRGPYNANKQSRYVELVLVVDNRQFKELDENMKTVHQHCKDIVNIINALYSPLNIYIALVGVVVWSEFDEIVFSPNGDVTLTNFLHYRREKLIQQFPNDNAQLLTKFTFDNGVVGKALKGPICTYEYSGGVNTEHSSIIGLVATTVAHEMGHNFGMEHDTNECSCPDERCIMAPSSSTIPPTHWSSCSLDYLALAFEHGMDYCLRNKPTRLFDSPVCGNGFVEPGEQCDCGLPQHCDNPCCNASDCMLYRNASCATGECCDLYTCMPKTAGTLCRSADYECDLPEFCTGQSEYCPDDIYKMDTESCEGGKAYCYHGFCRTRSDQCKLLWGTTGKSSDDQCYRMNTKGTRHGNCGYNKFNQSYFKCNDENVLCGMLHCKHLNERLEFGMESVAILSHSFINLKGSIIPCRTAIVDLGLNQVDPGLAPDGATCGEGKMCVNQKCMAVESLRTSIGACPNDCNGNGVCNSLGHCHCKDGYAPPDCDYPGHGGSADSGPASDPNAHKGFVTAMFIVFLGIIPAMALSAFAYYYLRHNLKSGKSWQKSPTTQKSPPKSRSPGFSTESPKKPSAEDNHSLLASAETGEDFFGHFKGFTLTPMKKKSETAAVVPEDRPTLVVRPAPAIPQVPKVLIKTGAALKRAANRAEPSVPAEVSAPPALPPLNPGAHPRPIISSPTLQNSTCTAKELISPLRNAPKSAISGSNVCVPSRAAPAVPAAAANETDIHIEIVDSEVPVMVAPKKASTLNRIASFLKPEKRAVKSKPTMDKEVLRSIQISAPIPQPVSPEKPVKRAQSMKVIEPSAKPKLKSFGSMRDPSKRPISMVGTRPKSPPPPAPATTKPEKSPNPYDDCLTAPLACSEDTSPSSDNIYAVIEDSPGSPPSQTSAKSPMSPKNTASQSTSSESFGLLGEIVSEIQNRNFDSIYSTSTLARKKREAEEAKAAAAAAAGPYYENTQTLKDDESVGTAEGEYSNMTQGKSSASSTSSGYIHPSAVNKPRYENTRTDNATLASKLSSFQNKASTASNNLRRPKASTATVKPKPTANSPDLVNCSTSKTTQQSPDVLNNSKKAASKDLGGKPKKPPIATKTTSSLKSKFPTKQSNVASLQQKFEGKT